MEYKCDKCGQDHVCSEELELHKTRPDGYVKFDCDRCHKNFYNDACLGMHRCTKRYIPNCELCGKGDTRGHACVNEFKCRCCGKIAVRNQHDCYMQPPKNPKIVLSDDIIEEYGQQYYAFDTESEMHADEDGR